MAENEKVSPPPTDELTQAITDELFTELLVTALRAERLARRIRRALRTPITSEMREAVDRVRYDPESSTDDLLRAVLTSVGIRIVASPTDAAGMQHTAHYGVPNCEACGRAVRVGESGPEHVEPAAHVNGIHVPVMPEEWWDRQHRNPDYVRAGGADLAEVRCFGDRHVGCDHDPDRSTARPCPGR